jgi:hypothetical protein
MARCTRETKEMFLVSFLWLACTGCMEKLNRERTRLPNQKGEIEDMKKLSVVVAGTGQIRDIEIQPGTTAGDVLHQLSLPDYLLSKGPNEPFFAAAESIYDKVKDGEKIFASTKAEVGITVCA